MNPVENREKESFYRLEMYVTVGSVVRPEFCAGYQGHLQDKVGIGWNVAMESPEVSQP